MPLPFTLTSNLSPRASSGARAREPSRSLPEVLSQKPLSGASAEGMMPISPRRVMVFKPSAILKQKINGESADDVEDDTDKH